MLCRLSQGGEHLAHTWQIPPANAKEESRTRKEEKRRPQTPDDQKSRKEKQDFQDQVEAFEGPDRREIRGERKSPSHPPGVSSS
jgi:hypothetical protein